MTLRNTSRLITLALGATLAAVGCQSTSTTNAPARGQTTTAAADALALSLVDAVQDNDRDALRALFGPRAEELRAGDPDQAAQDMRNFARQLGEGWEVSPIETTPQSQEAELLVGREAWPFAVPLVSDGARWWFDTDTGIDELASRRVGRNELKTIDALLTLIDAQRVYFSQDRDGDGVNEYADRLMSTPGTRDGLHWPAPGGVDPSPIGPDMAMAASRTDSSGRRLPFWGYRYHLIPSQATQSLASEWAVIAYPAEYGESGVMSFMASDRGVVYERDLGSSGASTTTRTTTFDPTGWVRVAGAP